MPQAVSCHGGDKQAALPTAGSGNVQGEPVRSAPPRGAWCAVRRPQAAPGLLRARAPIPARPTQAQKNLPCMHRAGFSLLVPRTGIEPVRPLQAADFKSDVSTNFTTEATPARLSCVWFRQRPSIPQHAPAVALLPTFRTDRKKGSLSFPFLKTWSGKTGSNRRPIPWQGIALPTELFPQIFWRREPESNWSNRICNPGHNRFAIAPSQDVCTPLSKLERENGFEPSTYTLARYRSTN